MKIKEIKQSDKKFHVYEVTFTPNWIEKMFGVEEKTKEYKDIFAKITFCNGTVYVDKDGNKLGNGNWVGEAIDKFRRQF